MGALFKQTNQIQHITVSGCVNDAVELQLRVALNPPPLFYLFSSLSLNFELLNNIHFVKILNSVLI